jgi:predicted lipid-binding transport protein (Tim44 family)
MMRNMKLLKMAFFTATLVLLAQDLWARAGGAGGGHVGGGGHGGGYGGGSGGGDIFYLVYFLLRSGPIGWLVLLGIAVAAYFFYQRYQSQQDESAADDFMQSQAPPSAQQTPAGEPGLLKDENPEEFSQKVAKAFLTIQDAWSQKRVDIMRRFITDGVYQRFNAQFTMMNLLGQVNELSEVRIDGIRGVKSFREGGYDCVDVRIHGSAIDQFTCAKFPNLDSPGGRESFTEYWSFIRRHDYKKGSDIFHSDLCPQCSAPLTDKLIESAQCPYCGTYLNSGEYDWVLAEITQENDYGRLISSQLMVPPGGTPAEKIVEVFPDYSQHVLEDRASNAFMQMLVATSTHNAAALQRFCTGKALVDFKAFSEASNFIYDRLFIRGAELLRTELADEKLRSIVAIQYSYHQVDAKNPRAQASTMSSDTRLIVMMRELSQQTAKGSVFANSCPACGAAQKDSLAPTCAYCGSSLMNPKLDWVVEGVLDVHEFRAISA